MGIAAAEFPLRRGLVLMDDDFRTGMCGWKQLVDGVVPTHPLDLSAWPAVNGSSCSLLLTTMNGVPDTGSEDRAWGACMALKRLSTPRQSGKYLVEYWWSWMSYRGENALRAIDFVVDEARADGQRWYWAVRWLNYDEAAASRVQKIQLRSGSSAAITYTDVAVPAGVTAYSAVYEATYNENKRNVHYLAYVIDTASNVYDGVQAGWQTYGSLYAAGNVDLRSVQAEDEGAGLAGFKNGFNVIVNPRGRTDTTAAHSEVNLCRCRVSVVG